MNLSPSLQTRLAALAATSGLSCDTLLAKAVEVLLAEADRCSPEGLAAMLGCDKDQLLYVSPWHRELTEHLPAMIWVQRQDGRCQYFNKAWREFSGKTLAQLLGENWMLDIHPQDAERRQRLYQSSFERRACFELEYRLKRHDGEYRWLIETAVPHFDANAEFLGYIGTCLDITPRKLAESKSNHADTAVDLMDDGVIVTCPDFMIQWVNPAFSKITGYSLDEVKGKKPSLLQSGKHDAGFYRQMTEKLASDECWQGEIWNRKKSGEIYPEWLSINVVRDEQGHVVNYVGIFTDITKQKAKEERSHYLSTHDSLTGLANRYLMEQVLDLAILNARRVGKGMAVLFIDLDGFKDVNDTFGHLQGDQLLKDVARWIKSVIRESDLAARLGGDEFVVILENLSSPDDAWHVARKISRPVHLSTEASAVVTFSIGISYYDGVGEIAVGTMLAQADAAMYQAKQAGKNGIQSMENSNAPVG